ncbi:hypothetical protein N7516_001026 [Penicillium verrucosum]|uniref:uncharacterized protein n=1 Tax=Penicillium verrucosum TaxID=60171 RepID=UPI00254554D3|nr:uncharacterized protein N7516_001026 [Penicillium verrucosum]KAJ5940858.1 hypothetical protein N7516_001026 [Penicillium verrucosum]
MTLICRCIHKCLGVCRRNRRGQNSQNPVLPVTKQPTGPDIPLSVMHPKQPASPVPPPPRDSEIVRTKRPARSSPTPTRTARRGRVSAQGGVARPGKSPKTKLSKTARLQLGKAAKAAGDSEDNISEEEYPPLPPSREGSHTGITPELSDIDINEPRDVDDIEIPDAEVDDTDIPEAEPGDELFYFPTAPGLPEDDEEDQEDISAEGMVYFGSRSRTDRPTTPAGQVEQAEQSPNSRKRGRVEDTAQEGQELSPAATAVRSPSPGFEDSFSDFEYDMYPMPKDAQVATFRRKGAQVIAWLEDPNEPNCDIAQTTTTLHDLMNNLPEESRFQVKESNFQNLGNLFQGAEPESMGLDTTPNSYRKSTVFSPVVDQEILDKFGLAGMTNGFEHIVGPGVLVATSIFRHDCVQWNVVARAVYEWDHPISTLRHIMFEMIVNSETAPYIRRVAYARHGRDFSTARNEPCLKIERGTREYEELLGTKLGRAAAILLISCFPRGTVRIARAVAWNDGTTELRFEIEPIPANP